MSREYRGKPWAYDAAHQLGPRHTKHRRVVLARFSLKFYRLPTDDESVVNGKTSKKSMQKRRGGFLCVKTLKQSIASKHYWFHVPLYNKTVISGLFGRIVKTMPLGTVDNSMHNCGLGQLCIELSTAPRGMVSTIHQTGMK